MIVWRAPSQLERFDRIETFGTQTVPRSCICKSSRSWSPEDICGRQKENRTPRLSSQHRLSGMRGHSTQIPRWNAIQAAAPQEEGNAGIRVSDETR
jgi:hypothetical protein